MKNYTGIALSPSKFDIKNFANIHVGVNLYLFHVFQNWAGMIVLLSEFKWWKSMPLMLLLMVNENKMLRLLTLHLLTYMYIVHPGGFNFAIAEYWHPLKIWQLKYLKCLKKAISKFLHALCVTFCYVSMWYKKKMLERV